VLQRARTFAPNDRSIGIMLAEARIATGQLKEAKTLLEELIEGFGQRRSGERAGVHLMLARVLAGRKKAEGALDQLDIAHKMDSSNLEVVRMLGELAQEAGQLERAERAYRALLLLVRDQSAAPAANRPIGPAEILLRLSFIAQGLGPKDMASERFESALEALIKDDVDARRVQAALIARDEVALVRRVLDTRLQRIESPQRRASVLAEYAELLQSDAVKDRPGALERWLQAIDAHPAAHNYHEAALALSRELDATARYRTLLEELLERTKPAAHSYARC
jgi:hypothetical protein